MVHKNLFIFVLNEEIIEKWRRESEVWFHLFLGGGLLWAESKLREDTLIVRKCRKSVKRDQWSYVADKSRKVYNLFSERWRSLLSENVYFLRLIRNWFLVRPLADEGVGPLERIEILQNQPKMASFSSVRTIPEYWSYTSLCYRQLMEELEKHDDAWPFLLPVNVKQFPTYRKVIKHPMDMQTLKAKLKDNSWVQEFICSPSSFPFPLTIFPASPGKQYSILQSN